MSYDNLLNKLQRLYESMNQQPPIDDEDPETEYHNDNVRATADFNHHEGSPDEYDLRADGSDEDIPDHIQVPDGEYPVDDQLPKDGLPEDKSLKTCGSIFSGIGGWEYGAKQVGLTPIFAFEYHQKYANAYTKSHGDHVTVGDVKQTKDQLKHSSVDVLFSSPPCQNYSVAKMNKNDEKPDSAKDVGLVTIEIAKKTNAKVILMENVVAYLESPVLNTIIEQLSPLYHIHTQTVDCSKYGCPTTRLRMLATFVRKDLFDAPFVPKPTNEKKDAPSWYSQVEDLIPQLKPGKLSPWQKARLDRWGIDKLTFPLQISGNNASSTSFKAGKNVRVFRQATEPSFTIVKSWRAMQQTRILFQDGKVLEANPHCFARWQSFPDAIFKNLPDDLQTATEMIGNAVPPQLCVNVLTQLKSI